MVIVVCSLHPEKNTYEDLWKKRAEHRTGGEGEMHQGMMGTPATWCGEHNAPAELDVIAWLPEEGK